ncbi:MAG: uroporphyrinogen-III C-methyltransferase [Chromatiales bacterium]|nr:uroporphyrinogen-III C-methyltransferase [Chromatiales bacterium]
MTYLPIFASLRGQPCLVVGGGAVAERKALQLVAAGARVTVNAPGLSPALEAAHADGRIDVARRPFDATLVPLQLLVIAATSDPAVNRAVAEAARAALRLCNVVDDPAASTWISPSVVDRSPLLIAVSSGGQAPVLARLVRQRLERWLPARLAVLADWAGSWRERVKVALPDVTARRRLWEDVLAGVLDARTGPAQAVIDGRTAEADAALLRRLGEQDNPGVTRGEAWLVGAGPGDPGLITASGLHCLQHADVVLHDRLVAPALLTFARRDAELIDVGKTGGGAATSQGHINELLIDRVRAGLRVCRLKGGDPYVFGRGSEEALALAAAGLPFRVIPGVTAASGCGAFAGIPLTHRHGAHAVTFVTAHLGAGPDATGPDAPGAEPDWRAIAALGQTLVVYMAGRRLAAVSEALRRHGRPADTPAAVVMGGTTDDQRVVSGTLGDIAAAAAAAGVSSPAILYVGDVVALREGLDWFRPAAPYNPPTSGALR